MKTLFVVTQINPATMKTKPTIINASQVQRIEASDQHAGLTVIEFGYMQPEVFVTESLVDIWDRLNGKQCAHVTPEPEPDSMPIGVHVTLPIHSS